MDGNRDEAEDHQTSSSPTMERNPSPPPGSTDEDDVDAIGDTVYSKHWLFSTLTHLIQIVAKHSEESADELQITDEEEEDLCKVWDMAMDKDVAGFLMEFKASDILLGVIAKSRCPRLTEICVGILGNMACFPDTCLSLSQNEALGEVLLLLFADSDPPTLLETSRLMLTCVSQEDVSSLWLQRIRRHTSVRSNLLFIMCSSTNIELLEKVGELVDKLFDLDEELMKTWIAPAPASEESEESDSNLDLVTCLLEATKTLRSESPNGLETYLHVVHLLTTVEEGMLAFASSEGTGKALWNFLSELVCEDLSHTEEFPVQLQEKKSVLFLAFAVLQTLYGCQDQWGSSDDTSLSLVATILRVIEFHYKSADQSTEKDEVQDEQIQSLAEVTAEFLADICSNISQETLSELLKKGLLTEKNCLSAAGSLLPHFQNAFQHLQSVLSEVDPRLADVMRKQFPA
ncbi:protein saal1 [Synchiropus splendidus]|uniref:protein saal1 n=1 Tax=Synchiropus splendidus TaxID=270530 RepID=UPI00237EE3E3|nr:protein saal1 [Synchiropus splendidus]